MGYLEDRKTRRIRTREACAHDMGFGHCDTSICLTTPWDCVGCESYEIKTTTGGHEHGSSN